jgi:type II restriction/modification system DNA methylase subunit YeeA
MNKANLKSYAPQARKDFIAAVTARANLLGLSEKAGSIEVAPAQTQGDVTLIGGQAWPAKVSGQRDKLIKRIRQDGFAPTMEAVAYTWFNRFAALRYMELHDYLGHGHRALSSTSGGLPDILTHATDLTNELPGLNAARVTELKLAGNRDGELYRMLLVAQCNALSRAMPFLFERIDDDSELLLPDNLLRSDSVIAKLVAEIPEEDWTEVEIIGWLYQFYISEKKDQVIGKVVKSEDIPAATQLFTPNWIVQYLVQNSVGRLWLMANPQSTLAKGWPYYITPAEQTPEVQSQLDAIIQTRVREDGDTLNPESITVLDPACGSGHILVVAYDVLKAIYLERGYQPRAIPRLILEKNLYGLDIDDRAAQMAGFALLMKARADDRRLFTATDDAGNLQSPKLNVLSLQESKGLSVDELATHLAPFQVQRATIAALVETFEHAKTFGSLIQIPYALKTHLAVLPDVLTLVKQSGDMYAIAAVDDLLPLVQQAQVLAMQFDAVVANPPYMGGKAMNDVAKVFVADQFPDSKNDLFSCFIERSYTLTKSVGYSAMVTMQSWMFLSSYQEMRERLLRDKSIATMAHLGPGGFDHASAMVVQTTAFVFMNRQPIAKWVPVCFRLMEIGEEAKRSALIRRDHKFATIAQEDLAKVPGSPLAYFSSSKVISAFAEKGPLENYGLVRQGAATSDNGRFLRLWHEVSQEKVGYDIEDIETANESGFKWFPYNKGGAFRKWYGNHDFLINYQNDGKELKDFQSTLSQGWTVRLKSREYYFKESVSWPKISAFGSFSVRYYPKGFIFDVAGCSFFPNIEGAQKSVVAFLNSNVAEVFLQILSPTVNFEIEHVKRIPFVALPNAELEYLERIFAIARDDWNAYERSWDFSIHPLVTSSGAIGRTIELNYKNWLTENASSINEIQNLEKRNNELFIDAYGLASELSSAVPSQQITLTSNPDYRYSGSPSDEDKWHRFRFDTAAELISYAIGCMMGRYSLDEPGLIYAHSGNVGFEPGRYATFPADADGIVPITDELWFTDDAPSRVREFLRAVWGPDTLEENMAWLAESLRTKASETPDETIRRYIADKFFKDHLQTYKKRPIYWLFSSGKQGAFQALVYLHRYHEGTLPRLRAEYVVPLTGKIQSRIEMLQKDALAASSTAARNKLAKEVEKLKKKHVELLAYDEQLRHYADMRITLDLDDGVKVNYGKFGDLLAEVKAVTGGAGED